MRVRVQRTAVAPSEQLDRQLKGKDLTSSRGALRGWLVGLGRRDT